MDFIAKTLREGAKKIISYHSPPGRITPDGEFQNSSHQEREILFILKGSVEYMLNGHSYKTAKGTAFLIDKWIPHAFGYREKDRDLCHLWLHLAKGHIYGSIVNIDKKGNKTILGMTREISSEVYGHISARWDLLEKETSPITPSLMDAYLKAPLNALLDEFYFQMEHPRKLTGKLIDSAVESIREHIIMSKGRNCSLEELEQLSGFSKYYLSHQFLRCTGKTIGECIEEVRVEYTATAILAGKKQKEIAYVLGFNSPANFWSWLRKHKTAVNVKKSSLEKGTK